MEIYLDNASTTKPVKPAIDACIYAMESEYGNPSSLHRRGFAAERLLNKSKATLAHALSCGNDEIVFTSGATESNNLALFGATCARKKGIAHPKIITTAIEHPSVLKPLEELAKSGIEIVYLKPQNGNYTAKQFADEVDENTILVSAMWVNNETGLILPIKEIGEQIKLINSKVLFHCDGVQGFLKQPISLKNTKIDLFSLSGHKIGAPKGIGALYIKKGVYITPQILGGGQQGARRCGTEPIPVIAALAAAIEFFDNIEVFDKKYSVLKSHLIDMLTPIKGVSMAKSVDTNAIFANNILSISVDSIRSETMLHFLEQNDIFVSSGSACAKGKQSHVLSAFGISKQEADCTLRISFFHDTTTQMLDIFAKNLSDAIASLAKIRK